ncbi:RING/U-box superfamily protein [Rhynchospora pubera]|uniref:RING/U-box superfamily protein n=1 Tax=Rhynchospora pubera TaxID=906938 RepID=A0AAV8HBK3_9POAL|nr:RING/U-box superfamily protein [Rhynchospora pubera]
MNPEFLEVPDTPDRMVRTIGPQPGRLRNLKISRNHRVEQPIILNSPTNSEEKQRKRKSSSSTISISENPRSEPRCNKKGKNVVQVEEEETNRGGTIRDNKGKGKLDVPAPNDDIQEIIPGQTRLNSPPRRVGRRLLVRDGAMAPSSIARGNIAFNSGTTRGALNAPMVGEEFKRGSTVRDDKGKGKLDVNASDVDIQEISPDQSGSSLPPRPVRRRFLVRNGVIAPSNIAQRIEASNGGITGEDANVPIMSEVEADSKVTVLQPSAVMLRGSGEHVPRPAGSQSVEGSVENSFLTEIVADDGLIRSRREFGATTSSTSSSRTTHSNRLGPFNQTSTGRGRPNPAVSTMSIPVTARPISGGLTSSNSTGGIGVQPMQRGRIVTLASLHHGERSSTTRNLRTQPAVSTMSIPVTARPISGGLTSANSTGVIGVQSMQRGRIVTLASLHPGESSSTTRNLRTQPTNVTAVARARGRNSQARGVVARPVIDLEEIQSPTAAQAQQLAHDEMIARQLQEELYNEVSVDRSIEEMDAYVAMSLQQEENAMRALRATPISGRASQAARSAQFRAAALHVRNNVVLQGQQMHQDFNPDDYEALLALDENNHRHTGASTRQINSLPESVVKSANFEDCAVCLMTPSVGEKIRHLPCLHKFHKDCIDLWLKRKKECPICKCRIVF